MNRPTASDEWIALTSDPLPVAEAASWAVLPRCGAVVTFNGTARDHSEGRDDVDGLEYEAYQTQVEPRLTAISAEARSRWPEIGRIAMIHRIGPVAITDSAVVVVVSAPHRDAAFAAARFCIDTLKATVPIWKRESWHGAEAWGLEAQHVRSVDAGDPAGLGVTS